MMVLAADQGDATDSGGASPRSRHSRPSSDAGTILDGATQTANSEDDNTRGPEIEIDGSGAGAGAYGLRLTGGTCLVRGLVIGGFQNSGIVMQTNNGNTVRGLLCRHQRGGIGRPSEYRQGRRCLVGLKPRRGSESRGSHLLSGNVQPRRHRLVRASLEPDNTIQGNFIGTKHRRRRAHLQWPRRDLGRRGRGRRLDPDNVISGDTNDGVELAARARATSYAGTESESAPREPLPSPTGGTASSLQRRESISDRRDECERSRCHPGNAESGIVIMATAGRRPRTTSSPGTTSASTGGHLSGAQRHERGRPVRGRNLDHHRGRGRRI